MARYCQYVIWANQSDQIDEQMMISKKANYHIRFDSLTRRSLYVMKLQIAVHVSYVVAYRTRLLTHACPSLYNLHYFDQNIAM